MAEVVIKHEFVNPQPNDVGPDTYTKPKHWNAQLLVSGGADLELLVRDAASTSGASYRALVGGTGITITPSGASFTVALSGSVISGSGTTGRVTRWLGPTTLGDGALRDDGTLIALNGAVNTFEQFAMKGTFAPSGAGAALGVSTTITGVANASHFGIDVYPTINKAGSGTHVTFASAAIEPPVIGAGAASLTNAATLLLTGVPSAGTNNFVLWAQAGGFRFDSTGPHSIGGVLNANSQLNITGTFTSAGAQIRSLLVNSTLSPAVNADAHTVNFGGTINEAASGTHDTFTTMFLTAPIIGAAGAALTNAATLRIQNEPTGATNNYAMWIAAGKVLISQAANHGVGAIDVGTAFNFAGTFTSGGQAIGVGVNHTLNPGANNTAFGTASTVTLNKAGSGTHSDFAAMFINAPTIGAGAATLTNASTVKIVAAPSVGDRLRALWVAAGLSEFGGIVSVSGAGGTVNTTQVGIELRGSSTPSLLAFNRGTSAYLNMVYDAATHDFQRNSASMFRVAVGDAQISQTGSWTGGTQTEGHRMTTTLNAVAAANAFGLIFAPTFVEAASGTHGQLTGIYIAPVFTNGAGSTTSVMGINIDMGAIGAIASTNAYGLRIAGPTGASGLNHALYVDAGTVRIDEYGHVIGGATNTGVGLLFTGTFPSGQTFARVIQIDSTVTANADGGNLVGIYLNPVMTERSGGTHTLIAGMYVSPTVTAGAASTTVGAGIYIDATTWASGTTDSAGLVINVGSGATNNYSILVNSGPVKISPAGGHVIGGATDASKQLLITGTNFGGGSGVPETLRITTSLQPGASSNSHCVVITPTFVEGTGGAHTEFNAVYIEPAVTAGTSTLGKITGINIASLVAQSGTTDAILIDLRTLPTGATNNYIFAFPTNATDPTGGGGAATGRIPVLIGGTLRYLAYY